MASQDEVKGEGFEVLGHEEPEKSDRETKAEHDGASESHEEDVKGEGFEVLGHEEPEGVDTQEEAAADRGAETSSATEATGTTEMKAIDVYAVLRLSVAQLAGVAWQMMGLQPDPFTNEVRKDPQQARIAIDATAALVELLKPHLQRQERREFESLLTDLRLNFLSHSDEKT
ncbi:MAG: DUF1844 domain-containing protein [Armatimonadetes bacterium]|nr:DUF1844 domain-containing protein [Armatimonadota bacterium]